MTMIPLPILSMSITFDSVYIRLVSQGFPRIIRHYFICPLNFENHAFNVIKYIVFGFFFSLHLKIEPTASGRLDIAYRILNNEPAANFTYISIPFS